MSKSAISQSFIASHSLIMGCINKLQYVHRCSGEDNTDLWKL